MGLWEIGIAVFIMAVVFCLLFVRGADSRRTNESQRAMEDDYQAKVLSEIKKSKERKKTNE